MADLGISHTPILACSDRGSLLVASNLDKRLCFISADGSLSGITGSAGEGPGEFQEISAVSWLPDGKQFLAYDVKNLRITRWSSQGKLIGETSVVQKIRYPAFAKGVVFFLQDIEGQLNSTPTLYRSTDLRDHRRERIWKHGPLEKSYGIHADLAEGTFTASYPWDPKPVLAAGETILAVGHTDTASITVFNIETQKKVAKIQFRFPVPPLSEEQVEEEFQQVPVQFKPFLKRFFIKPDFWPMFRHLFIDGDQVFVVGNRLRNGRFPVKVFDYKGKLLLEGALDSRPLAIRNQHFYGMVLGSEDEESLVKIPLSF